MNTPQARIRHVRRMAEIARHQAHTLGADPLRAQFAGNLCTAMHRAGFAWREAIKGAALLVSR